jgi:hypothetical protein
MRYIVSVSDTITYTLHPAQQESEAAEIRGSVAVR